MKIKTICFSVFFIIFIYYSINERFLEIKISLEDIVNLGVDKHFLQNCKIIILTQMSEISCSKCKKRYFEINKFVKDSKYEKYTIYLISNDVNNKYKTEYLKNEWNKITSAIPQLMINKIDFEKLSLNSNSFILLKKSNTYSFINLPFNEHDKKIFRQYFEPLD